jgi:hypothetical protein
VGTEPQPTAVSVWSAHPAKSTTFRLRGVRSLTCSTFTTRLNWLHLKVRCRMYLRTAWHLTPKLTNCPKRSLPSLCSTKAMKTQTMGANIKLGSGSRPTTRTAKWAKSSSRLAKSACWTSNPTWWKHSSNPTRSGNYRSWAKSSWTSVKMTGTNGSTSPTQSTPSNAV